MSTVRQGPAIARAAEPHAAAGSCEKRPSITAKVASFVAHIALDDISAKLARNDLAAFETHGRFIETRYKDEGLK